MFDGTKFFKDSLFDAYQRCPWRRGSGAVAIFYLSSRRGSNFSFSVAARQRQMFSRDGHL